MHDHDHAPRLSGSGRHQSRLAIVLALVVAMLVVEVVVAVSTGSLALLSDAGHLVTDVAGLTLAFTAISIAGKRAPAATSSFGWYRLEVLAALANAALLIGVAVVVFVGAVRRFGAPVVEIEPVPLLVTGGVALIIEFVCAWLLRPGSDESLNLEGARLEVLADAVGTIGVLVAAGVIQLTGWTPIDAIVAVAIAVWLLPRAILLGRRSLRVLLQHAPDGVDVDALEVQLRDLPGVTDVHDLHVWTLTSGMDVASVHVAVRDRGFQHDAQHAVRQVLATAAHVDHATVQVELAEDPNCCAEHPTSW